MGSGAAGQPMNSDDTSWPFTSPAGRDASKPHEIDLYIEPSPRDSPTALPKLFTTLEPEPLGPAHANANAHVEEDLSSTPPSRDSPTTLPTPEAETSPEASGATSARAPAAAGAGAPARTVEFYQAGSPGIADIEFFVEEDDTPASTSRRPTTRSRRRRPPPAPASTAASDLVPAWLSTARFGLSRRRVAARAGRDPHAGRRAWLLAWLREKHRPTDAKASSRWPETGEAASTRG